MNSSKRASRPTRPVRRIAGWPVPTLLVVLAASAPAGDPLAPRPNGPMPAPPTRVLIDNAVVHVAPGRTLERADILIVGDRIARVAESIDPATDARGARVVDAAGMHVYPGFIDAYVPVDAPAPKSGGPGTHWSNLVTPQRDALAGSGLGDKDAGSLRDLGFTAAGIAPSSGIFRGWGAVVSVAEPYQDPALGRPPVYRARAAQHLGFERAGWSSGAYPTSHMGVVSLIRQTFIDAQARAAQPDHADASCLDAIDPDAIMFYATSFELEALLGDKVAREFGHARVAFVGSGEEYKRLDALAAAARPVVVPLGFPESPDASTVGASDALSLAELLAWEHAPSNARYLDERGVPVSITSSKLPKAQKFWDNLRRAIDAGLAPDRAMAMLTTNPAELLGVSDTLGTVEAGKAANLVIASGPLFQASDSAHDDDGAILELYIDGRPHHIADPKNARFDGRWTINADNADLALTIEIEGNNIKAIEPDAERKARKVKVDRERISFIIDDAGDAGTSVFSATLGADGVIRGSAVRPDQTAHQWTATRQEAPANTPDAQAKNDENDKQTDKPDDDKDKDDNAITAAPVGAPFGAYTVERTPEQRTVLLTHATVWTQSDDGILEDAWVLVRDGTIAQIGTGGYPKIAAEVIDCTGKHITPGLIDAHSHTGLFRLGVNESGQAVTAEVRIADSIDPGHINWYRQLAGGVTTANLLHGSANPIGGQSQTVKNRWGSLRPEDMLFENAKPGIKFALGENVKQSNWGDDNTTRYPQTRLGVETIIRDRFTKAREYASARATTPNQARSGAYFTTNDPGTQSPASAQDPAPPRDLELETLAEILAGDRLVHCHSYRQDEILMLCRVAEDFGFRIGTFQHGLETYKVAEIVREHAIGASIFSDWWAYKVEVQDAIPYAGPINHETGLLTSFNSDSDELARRMNAEAGKALRYARQSGIEMTPQQALDFVTKNPAIQLAIFDRVGSIEPGKDADLAVWSGDPLSSMSRCERTFVDGRQLFSLEHDAAMQSRMRAERARLIARLLEDKNKSKPDAEKPTDKPETNPTDQTPPRTARERLAHAARHAIDRRIADGPLPGDCGCETLPRLLDQHHD